MRSIGLDVHRDFCEVAIFEDGKVIRHQRVSARRADPPDSKDPDPSNSSLTPAHHGSAGLRADVVVFDADEIGHLGKRRIE